MSILRKNSQDAAPAVQEAERTRDSIRSAVWGETGNNPNIVKAHHIIDGDWSYSSQDIDEKNKGS